MPEITALMSVYNGEKYIYETIETILNQSFTDFELLIVDDGSTDNTVKIIETFKDKRIKLLKLKENVGVGAALRYSLDFIDSKYVIKVDSDDINHKERFKLQKEFMDKRPEIAVSKCLINYFYEDSEDVDSNQVDYMMNVKLKAFNEIVKSEDIAKSINYCLCVHHCSMIIRTEALKKVNYDSLRSGEDHILFYKLNKLGYKFATLKKELVKIRIRKNSLTVTKGINLDFLNLFLKIKTDEIVNFINGSEDIIIWGTGNLSEFIVNKLKDISIKPIAFIDGRLKMDDRDKFLSYDVFSKNILKEKKYKVIIAAAPAIYSAQEFLKSIGYVIDSDYYIFYG